jgi:hypothetical protein
MEGSSHSHFIPCHGERDSSVDTGQFSNDERSRPIQNQPFPHVLMVNSIHHLRPEVRGMFPAAQPLHHLCVFVSVLHRCVNSIEK